MSPPSWRVRIAIVLIAMIAVLVAAWVYVPEFKDGLVIVWGDVKAWSRKELG